MVGENTIAIQRRMAAIEPKAQRLNEQIRTSPVRVIAADGTQLGILPVEEALAAAGQHHVKEP